MSDIRTTLAGGAADYVLANGLLADDDGLQTAVVISLFTDRRAADDDVLPDSTDQADRDPRGWWGDTYADQAGDQIGSRLWLLAREKQLQVVVERARQYAQEALQWLVDDGVARSVDVTAEIVRDGVLGLAVEIARPRVPVARFRFERFWKGL